MSKGTLTGLLDVALDLAKEALGVTRLQAQLDACSDACELSEDAAPLKPGDSAWSHAYEDVADLRRDWLREVGISNQQSAEMTRLGRELARANNEVGRLSKCAAEHEKKSNDRRLELVAIAQALGCPVVKEKMLERIAELKGDTFKAPALTWSDWAPGTWFSWELNREVNGHRRTADNGYSVTAAGGQWFATGGHKGGCQDNDFAREAADACLVNQGTLEPSRAFVRMGDWAEDSVCHFRTLDGTPFYFAYSADEKADVDAKLVSDGLLDPARAFKTPAQAFTVKTLPPGQVFETSSDGGKTWHECPPGNSYRSDWLTRTRVVDPFKAFDMTPGGYAKALDAVDKASAPMWGDWSNESRQQGIDGPTVGFWLRTSTTGGIAYAAPRQWGAIGGYRGDATDIDDAREKADAHLVSIGELEAKRAFDRLGDWDEFVDGMWVRSSTRNAIRVNRVGGWEVFAVLGGRPVLIAAGQETCDAGKEAVDALLAQHGLLDPSRAFKVNTAGPFTLENVQNAAEKLRAASAPKCNALGEPDDAGTFYAANQGLPVQGPGVDLGKEGAK